MFYWDATKEGVIELSASEMPLRINGYEYDRSVLLAGKFLLYGYFIEYTKNIAEFTGEKQEVIVYRPYNAIILFKYGDFIAIMTVFIYDNIRHVYLSLVTENEIKDFEKIVKQYDIYKFPITINLDKYVISKPEV